MGPGPASGRFDFCFVFTSRKGLRCMPRAKLSALTRSDHLGRGGRGGQESNALPQATERGPWDCSPQSPGGSASPRPPDPPPGESRERVLGLERRKAGPCASQRPAPPEIAVARPAGLSDAARLQEPAVHSPRQRERTEQRDPARGTRAAPEASGRQCRLGVAWTCSVLAGLGVGGRRPSPAEDTARAPAALRPRLRTGT